MVWGWNYQDGPGDYAYALLQRTEQAPAFRTWHAREAARRAWLRQRVQLDDFSGDGVFDLSLHSEAEDLAELKPGASLEDRVAWHLTNNLFPPVPTSMVSVCTQAIRFAGPGLDLETVWMDLPSSVSFKPADPRMRRSPTIAEVIRQHSLSRFILDDDGLRRWVGREWDVNDALEAWDLANEGKWEIPSPIPSWPEYLTLLLVGRNFLSPGEEDDPGERDQIRSWWGTAGWRRGYNAGWWDAETVHLMSLPDPGAEALAMSAGEVVRMAAATVAADTLRTAPGQDLPAGKPCTRPAIVILTGAGISAESGLSTFRDANGLWRNHRIEEIASPDGFARNPALVHKFYDLRRRAALEAEPNTAHRALALLETVEADNVLIITQNVDDLHERAGSKNVIHMHGELNSALCTACGTRHPWKDDLGKNPPCPSCGKRALRPDVVWFGENVRQLDEIRTAVDHGDLFVAVGTSGKVAPAAGFAARASAAGASTQLVNLEVNDDTSPYDSVRLGPASLHVPKLVDDLFNSDLGHFHEVLATLPSVLRDKWSRAVPSRLQRLRSTYAQEHPDWDPEYDDEPFELRLTMKALEVRASREFLADVDALSAEDFARFEQQSKADAQRRAAAADQAREAHRLARFKRTGRLENLYIAVEALADSSFQTWRPMDPHDVPGLLPGAQDAVFNLHGRDYNVVLIAPEGMPLNRDDPTFWNWYLRHFGSGEGLWPDQLMMNWSSAKLRGWDLLVAPFGSNGRGWTNEGEIVELGSPKFPDWSAVVTYLEHRN